MRSRTSFFFFCFIFWDVLSILSSLALVPSLSFFPYSVSLSSPLTHPFVEITSSLRGEICASKGIESLPVSTKTERLSPVLSSTLSGVQRAMVLIGSESWKRRFPVEGFSWEEEEADFWLRG